MLENAYLVVEQDKIRHNTQILRNTLKEGTKIISVIKANGYGLDMVQLAHLSESMGIDILAVLDVPQGIELREAGITSPILLLGAVLEGNYQYLIDYDLIQVAFNKEAAQKMSDYALSQGTKIKVHLKHDTGLNRLGMTVYDEILSCYSLAGLDVQGIYTHFVAGQSYEHDDVQFSKKQINEFKELLALLRADGIDVGMTHMQNSPSILQFGDLGFDAVRCGMVMFGLFHPSQLQAARALGYQDVFRFETHICMKRTLHQGDAVGYSRTFVCDRDIEVATLSTGYCDGIMKGLSLNGGGVVVNGVLCPIVGDIAMSQFMIDVSGVDCKVGDVVTVFGHPLQTIYDTIALTNQSINEFVSALRYTMLRIYE